MMKYSGSNNHTGEKACLGSTGKALRKWLAGFLAASTAFTMLGGSAASLMAEETMPAAELALAGAGSGQDVTVHFGTGEEQDISIHVNPETGLEESETAAGFGAGTEAQVSEEVETEVETEAETEAETETETETQAGLGMDAQVESVAASEPTVAYVDQFGDLISDAYAAMPLPEAGEDGIIVLTASEEYKPVSDFAVWKDLSSKVIQYSYVRAKVGSRTVKALRWGTSEENAYLADLKTSDAETVDTEDVSGADASDMETDGSIQSQSSFEDGSYYYTCDNETWQELEDTDAVTFVFTSGKQREYTFEDDNVKVTATLQHAWAIPDGAVLTVTQITPKSDEYNYSAYMEALNQRAAEAADADVEEAAPYNENNTLFYDIAFIAVKYDEEGNPVEGSEYEYEPADGSVALSVEFKESQLTKTLGAESAEDITVFHLPLAQDVKEGSDTTAQATEITASDISVETVSYTADNVSLGTDTAEAVSFTAESFSTFVFTSGSTQSYSWTGSRKFTMSDILSSLGSLTNFAVVAGTLNTGDHIEGNIRVGTFEILGSGAEMNSGSRVDTYNNPDTFTVTKTVKNGDSDSETFQFVIVDETTDEVLKSFSITAVRQSDGTVFGSVTFTEDGSGGTEAAAEVFSALYTDRHTVRVYELDADGQRISDGGKNGTMTVTYNSSDSSGEAGEIGNSEQNYVGEFDYQYDGTLEMAKDKLGPFVSGEEPHTRDGYPSNYIYFGDDNDVCIQNSSVDYFTYDPDLKSIISDDLTQVANLSSTLAKAYNGDTETTGSKNIGSNLNVINLVSTTGNLLDDLSAAGFLAGTSVQSNVINGLLSSGEYLLINIDVGTYTNYTINGQSIYYDKENPQGNNGYTDLGNHIIYNLVTSSDNQNTFTAYDQTVTIADWSAGLLLAPRADIVQDSYWVGEIIGGKVTHRGAEIHKKTTVSGTNREVTVDVVNAYPDDTDFSVKKKWLDGLGNEIDAPVDSIRVKLYRMAAKPSGRMYTVNIYDYYSKKSYGLRTVLVKRPDAGTAAPFKFVIYDPDQTHSYTSWDNYASALNIVRDGDYVTFYTDDLAQNHHAGVVTVRIVCNGGTVHTDNSAITIPDGSYTAPVLSTIDSEEDTNWTNYQYLTSSNGWTYTPTGSLDAVDSDGYPYYYYAEEADDSGEYEITYDNNGVESGTVTITNTIPNKTQIDVEKKWTGTPNVDEVSFDLYYVLGSVQQDGAVYGSEDLSESGDGTRYGTYTITAEDDWKTTVAGLPLYLRSSGEVYQYYYYVKEKDVVGYLATYKNNTGLSSGTIIITNEEKTTDLEVEKVWMQGGSTITDTSDLPVVTVNVYRVKTEKDTEEALMMTRQVASAEEDTEEESDEISSEEGSGEISSDNSALQSASTESADNDDSSQSVSAESTDNDDAYQIASTESTDDDDAFQSASSESTGDNDIVDYNSTGAEEEQATSDGTVVLKVYDCNGTHVQTLNISKGTEDYIYAVVKTPMNNVWWFNLYSDPYEDYGQMMGVGPTEYQDGQEYYYYRSSAKIRFDKSSSIISGEDEFALAVGSMPSAGSIAAAASVEAEYSNKTSAGDDTPIAELYAKITLSSENNWKASISKLPTEGSDDDGVVYTYSYYVEEAPVTGCEATYSSGITLKVSAGGEEKNLYGLLDGAITITNSIDETEIPVSKQWQDDGGKNGRRPSKITIHLLADETETASADVTPDENGNWSYSFTGLPRYSYEEGTASLIKYEVTEDAVEWYTLTKNTAQTNEDGSVTSVELVNTEIASYSMPATGGEGTRMLYLMSLILISIAGAGLILVRRRKGMTA